MDRVGGRSENRSTIFRLFVVSDAAAFPAASRVDRFTALQMLLMLPTGLEAVLQSLEQGQNAARRCCRPEPQGSLDLRLRMNALLHLLLALRVPSEVRLARHIPEGHIS
jgi:hypothetical protein